MSRSCVLRASRTVTSSNHYGAPAKHSNHGAPVDIAAPGTGIQVLSNTGTDRAVADTYANRAGTSFATPLVAGVVALMHSRSPGALSPAQVEAALKRNATPFATAPANANGAGIVDAGRVLDETTRTQVAIWEAILGVGPPKI